MKVNDSTGEVEDDTSDDYELIGRWFEAQFRGHCTLDWEHPIRRGDKVSRVQHAGNPMLPVTGVACSACVVMLPHA